MEQARILYAMLSGNMHMLRLLSTLVMSVRNVARQALPGGAASADLPSIALLNARRLTGIFFSTFNA